MWYKNAGSTWTNWEILLRKNWIFRWPYWRKNFLSETILLENEAWKRNELTFDRVTDTRGWADMILTRCSGWRSFCDTFKVRKTTVNLFLIWCCAISPSNGKSVKIISVFSTAVDEQIPYEITAWLWSTDEHWGLRPEAVDTITFAYKKKEVL